MLHAMFKTSFVALILTLSCYLAPAPVAAQIRSTTEPAEIRGQVRYALGGAPAHDVIVRLEALSGGFVGEERTDNLGKFRFTNLSPIQYFVYVRHPGFKEIQREVNLVMTASDYIQLQLMPDGSETGAAAVYTPTKVVDANAPPEALKEFERADRVLADAKLDEGARHLERAVEIYPKFLEAELRLGTVYMDLQQWDRAEHALKKSLEINPKTANAYFALGELYSRQRNYLEAERALRGGLAIEDRSYRGHFALARFYRDAAGTVSDAARRRDALERAYQEVSRVIELNPRMAEAHLLKGDLLMRVPRTREAVAEFEEYLRLDPKGKAAGQTKALVEKRKRTQGEQKAVQP